MIKAIANPTLKSRLEKRNVAALALAAGAAFGIDAEATVVPEVPEWSRFLAGKPAPREDVFSEYLRERSKKGPTYVITRDGNYTTGTMLKRRDADCTSAIRDGQTPRDRQWDAVQSCLHDTATGDATVVRILETKVAPGWYDANHESRLSIEIRGALSPGRMVLPAPQVRVSYSDCTIWGCLLGSDASGTLQIREDEGHLRIAEKIMVETTHWDYAFGVSSIDVMSRSSVDVRREVEIAPTHGCWTFGREQACT